MENELDLCLGEPRSQLAQINITALILMAVLIIGVMAVKYLSPHTFTQFKEWYAVYILDETVPFDIGEDI